MIPSSRVYHSLLYGFIHEVIYRLVAEINLEYARFLVFIKVEEVVKTAVETRRDSLSIHEEGASCEVNYGFREIDAMKQVSGS